MDDSGGHSNASSHADKCHRPDVSARLKLRKTLVEQCVKCALPSRLAPSWDSTLRDILLDNVERQVRSTSEITVRGSLIVNEVLLQCLRHDKPLPVFSQAFFNACFLQGLKTSTRESRSDFSIVRDVFENEFYDYPPIQRNRGDCQAITIAAARYGTNFKTSLLHSFLGRQKSFIGTWLTYQQKKKHEEHYRKERGLNEKLDHLRTMLTHTPDKKGLEEDIEKYQEEVRREREKHKNAMRRWKDLSAFEVQCAINGWGQRTKARRSTKRKRNDADPESEADRTPQEVRDFIERERALLNNPREFEITDRMDVGMLLRYLFHILNFYREHDVGNGFSLAPVCKIKRHFMTIDTTGLYELLKNVAAEADTKLCPPWLVHLRHVPLKQLFKNPKVIDAMWRDTFDLDGLRRRRTFGKQIDTDGVSMVVHFHATCRQRTKHAKRVRQRRQRQTSTSSRVIAIDPGRSNLVTALDSSTSKTKTLTRRDYYHRAGIKRATAKVALWEFELLGVGTSLAKTAIRTTSARLSYEYRQVIIRNYERLWRVRTERKRAKLALSCYAGKQRVLDTFFAHLADGNVEPAVVAYGAATFHPTGKGEQSVPVKRVLRVCRRHLRTEMVNEHLTTKVHHACGERLNPVSQASSRIAIRGLCWCQTCSKFVSRDGNAARNIMRVYRLMTLGKPRPHDLRFGQPKQTMQLMRIVR